VAKSAAENFMIFSVGEKYNLYFWLFNSYRVLDDSIRKTFGFYINSVAPGGAFSGALAEILEENFFCESSSRPPKVLET